MSEEQEILVEPLNAPFGWPLPKRRELFEKVKVSAKYQKPLELMGQTYYLPVIRVPQNLPKYRLLNGRTASAQQEYLAMHPAVSQDIFTRDHESEEAQRIQNDLLLELSDKKGLNDFFKNPDNKQDQPIILDENGFVINGNRRLCTWRKLFKENKAKYGHFEYIDAIVLPPCDDRTIDKLEGKLQLEPDIKEDYTWDSLANMMKVRMELHGLDEDTIADFYNKKASEIRLLLDMLEYARDYLVKRGKTSQWSFVSANEFAFKEIVLRRAKLNTPGEKQLFQEAAYDLIDDVGGDRLYAEIRNLQKYFVPIKSKLQQEFPIAKDPEPLNPAPLGGQIFPSIELPLAREISKPENGAKARDLIRDVIESQESLNKDKKSADFLFKQLNKANSFIQGAIASGLKPETNKSGVAEQINSIEEGIETIKKWLK